MCSKYVFLDRNKIFLLKDKKILLLDDLYLEKESNKTVIFK